MAIQTVKEAENLIYRSYLKAQNVISKGSDAVLRQPHLTRQLLDLVSSPDRVQRTILVTGSKGKGSTSRFISSILSHLGYKVGLFTSPHLVHFRERIRVDGKAISGEDFVRLANQIAVSVEQLDQEIEEHEYIGPIGIALTIASLYFKEQQTDFNVIECGRGGAYDDANVLHNEWAVITPIMAEHLDYLGPDIFAVMEHKLGIVKQGTRNVFIGKQREDVIVKIKEHLNQTEQSNGILDGQNVYFNGESFKAESISMNKEGTSFTVITDQDHYAKIQIPLLGKYQADNIAMAIKVCETILGVPLQHDRLYPCLNSLSWPGRCEIIATNPTVVVDGAINEAATQYLTEVIKTIDGKNVISIIGVPGDKDYEGVIKVCSQFSSQIIVTKPDHTHLTFSDEVVTVAKRYLPNSMETAYLREAVDYALNLPDVDVILIVGTQHIIGNAKRLWDQSLLDIGK